VSYYIKQAKLCANEVRKKLFFLFFKIFFRKQDIISNVILYISRIFRYLDWKQDKNTKKSMFWSVISVAF